MGRLHTGNLLKNHEKWRMHINSDARQAHALYVNDMNGAAVQCGATCQAWPVLLNPTFQSIRIPTPDVKSRVGFLCKSTSYCIALSQTTKCKKHAGQTHVLAYYKKTKLPWTS